VRFNLKMVKGRKCSEGKFCCYVEECSAAKCLKKRNKKKKPVKKHN